MSHWAFLFCEDNTVDAQGGDDLSHMNTAIGLAIIIVDAPAKSVFLQTAAKNQLQCREVALEAETTMEQKAAVIIDKGVQICPTRLAGPLGVGKVGAVEHIALP